MTVLYLKGSGSHKSREIRLTRNRATVLRDGQPAHSMMIWLYDKDLGIEFEAKGVERHPPYLTPKEEQLMRQMLQQIGTWYGRKCIVKQVHEREPLATIRRRAYEEFGRQLRSWYLKDGVPTQYFLPAMERQLATDSNDFAIVPVYDYPDRCAIWEALLTEFYPNEKVQQNDIVQAFEKVRKVIEKMQSPQLADAMRKTVSSKSMLQRYRHEEPAQTEDPHVLQMPKPTEPAQA